MVEEILNTEIIETEQPEIIVKFADEIEEIEIDPSEPQVGLNMVSASESLQNQLVEINNGEFEIDPSEERIVKNDIRRSFRCDFSVCYKMKYGIFVLFIVICLVGIAYLDYFNCLAKGSFNFYFSKIFICLAVICGTGGDIVLLILMLKYCARQIDSGEEWNDYCAIVKKFLTLTMIVGLTVVPITANCVLLMWLYMRF